MLSVADISMNSLHVSRLIRVASSKWNSAARFSTVLPQASETIDVGVSNNRGAREPYWHKLRPDKIVREFDGIPGPKFLPFIGHEWRYKVGVYSRDRIHHTYRKMFDKYGYVVRENIGKDRIIVHLFHDEDIFKVYSHDGKYPRRQSNRIVEQYRKERPEQYSCAGLGPSNGEEWYQFRLQFNKVQRSFMTGYNEDRLEQLASDLVTKITSGLDKNGEVDIMPDFYRWALEGVGVVALNKRLGCLDQVLNPEADKLIEAAHTTNDAIFRTETSAHGWNKQYKRLVPAQDYFSTIVRHYINQAIVDRNNMLDKVCKPETDMRDMCTFVLDLFQGGIHTTALAAAFAFYHLARNPSVQEKLRNLIKENALNDDVKLMKLPYLSYVIRETLRMNPTTVGNGRILSVPLVLGGYKVPENTMVLLQHMTACRLEEHFPSPHLFKPERFATWEDKEFDPKIRDRTNAAFMPFGFGMRACIGRNLAIAQTSLAIIKVLKQYELSYHHGEMDTVNRLHNEPNKPMKIRFKPLS